MISLKRFRIFLVVLPFFLVFQVTALEPREFRNAEEQERFQTLAYELRCPKCDSQNIADSNAPIAADLRGQIFQMLQQDKSDDEIVGFLVDRYGEFVRYRPTMEGKNLLLWFGPAGFFLIGLISLFFIIRRNRVSAKETEGRLSSNERERLNSLLGENKKL